MRAEGFYKRLPLEKTKELTLFGFAEAYHKAENKWAIEICEEVIRDSEVNYEEDNFDAGQVWVANKILKLLKK